MENSPLAPVFHAWPSLLHSLKTWVKQRPRAKKFNQFLIISEIVNLFLDKWIFCAKLLEIAVSADFPHKWKSLECTARKWINDDWKCEEKVEIVSRPKKLMIRSPSVFESYLRQLLAPLGKAYLIRYVIKRGLLIATWWCWKKRLQVQMHFQGHICVWILRNVFVTFAVKLFHFSKATFHVLLFVAWAL